MLPDVLLDLKAVEARQRREFSSEFAALMNRPPRPGDLSGDEALELATEAVRAYRRERRR